MLAAMRAGQGLGEIPHEVRLALQCERWGALPCAGGMLDQPVRLMHRMTTALGIFRAFKAYTDKAESDADWSVKHTDLWRTVVSTERLAARLLAGEGGDARRG